MGSLQFCTLYVLVHNVQYCHRWRIVTEEKTKVVTTVWGTELIPFLAALAIMQKYDLKKGLNSSYSSYRPGAIHPFDLFLILSRCSSFYSLNCPGAKQLALQGIESILSPKPQRRPCPFFYVFLLFLRVLPSICSVGKEGYLQHRTLWFACHICLYRCATTCAGAAGAAEGEAEADRGHHDREDGGGAQARQVHRGQEAARALLREGAHRAHRLW